MSKKETAEAWANILIERWQVEIDKKRINDTGALRSSFERVVHETAGGDVQKIAVAYHFYGWFVDLGVGKGQPLEDVAAQKLLGSRRRKPKQWIGKVLGKETYKLAEIMAEKYTNEATGLLLNSVPGKIEL